MPVSQIVPIITLKNDRYLYFPLIGLAGLASTLFTLCRQRFPRQQLVSAGVALLLVLFLSILAGQQAAIWRDEITLWGYTVRKDPENRLAWLMLARAYTQRHSVREAVAAQAAYKALRDKYGPVRGWEKY